MTDIGDEEYQYGVHAATSSPRGRTKDLAGQMHPRPPLRHGKLNVKDVIPEN